MLEAFQSLQKELATQKKVEVESSPPTSKPGSSSNNAAHLDLPPRRSSTNIQSEAMDVDYGPALPPRLVLNQDTSNQYVAPPKVIPKRSRTLTKSKAIGCQLTRVLPRTNYMRIPTNLGSLLLDLRNTLTRASTNQGLDMCPFLQRKISPL